MNSSEVRKVRKKTTKKEKEVLKQRKVQMGLRIAKEQWTDEIQES